MARSSSACRALNSRSDLRPDHIERRYPFAMGLEKYQRNGIFQEIVAGGLEPTDCDLTEGAEEVRVSHMPSGSYFTLLVDGLRYAGRYVVGQSEISWPYEAFSWSAAREKVRRWAQEVKEDFDSPDLWAELRSAQGILPGLGHEGLENTRFTSDEQAQIVEQFRQIKEFVRRTNSLSEAQTRSIGEKLDDIAGAAGRVGRKDWLLMFGGVILSVIMADLLTREVVLEILVVEILVVANRGLGDLFDWVGTVPPLSP